MSWPNSINAAYLVNRRSALFIINDMAEGLSQIPATRRPLPAPDMRQLRNIMSVQPIAQPNKYWVPRPAILRRAGMLRSLGLIGTLWTAYELYRQAVDFYAAIGESKGFLPVFPAGIEVFERTGTECFGDGPGTLGSYSALCVADADPTVSNSYNRYTLEPPVMSVSSSRRLTVAVWENAGLYENGDMEYRRRGKAYVLRNLPGPGKQPIEIVLPEARSVTYVSAAQLAPLAPPAPAPWLVPPLMQPGAAPRLKPGYADNRSQALMPEDSSAGYGSIPRPYEPDYLPSRRPRKREKEIKFRVKNSAAGRAIEWAIGMATEALDWSRALFEALPYWRKMEIINRYRTLEVRQGRGRFSSEARLRYVPLNAAEMLTEVYKFQSEIVMADLVTNIWTMLGSDRAWSTISKSMGRYQQGPWDSPRDMPRVDPEWQTYLPWLEPDSVHDRGVLEDAVGQPLTDKEIDRLYAQWDRWSSHRPFDPGQLNR